MKKTLLFSLALASAASFAGEVNSSNTFGLLKIADTGLDYLLVSVPWNQFGTGSTAVNIATLVNPDQFDSTARLYVPDGTIGGTNKYQVFRIENNVWTGVNVIHVGSDGVAYEVSGASADKTTVERGEAVWLYRGSDSTKANAYLLGQAPDATGAEVNVIAGSNLIAPPYDSNFKISDFPGAKAGDTIRVNNNSGSTLYTFKNSTWYKYSPSSSPRWSAVTDDDVIPMGTGFWFTTTEARTITFTNK